MSTMHDNGFVQRMRRIEALVHQVEALPDSAARDACRAVVQSILELHAAALERTVRLLGRPDAAELRDEWLRDALVGSVLLLHELHPWPLEQRIESALARLRDAWRERDIGLTLRDASPARIRIAVTLGPRATGCGTSPDALRSTILDVLADHAPEVERVEIEGLEAPAPPKQFVQLTINQAAPSA